MSFTNQMKLGRKDVVGAESVGQIGEFQDLDLTTNPGLTPLLLSGLKKYAVLVMNDTGGVVTPGLGYTYKSGYIGTRVGALSGANAICDGIADPDVVGTIADGEYFWLIICGPTRVMVGAGDLTANAVVQTLAAGEFGSGVAGTNPIGHCGKAIAAGTDGNLTRVYFTNPFAAVQP